MEKENWVLISLLKKLLSGIFKKKHVSIVEWVSQLESINGISVSLLDLSINLSWGDSVLIELVVELNVSNELHA